MRAGARAFGAKGAQRAGRVSEYKDASPLSLRGAKRRGNPYSCGRAWQRAALRANTEKCYGFAQSTANFVMCFCWDADCHTSSPQSPPCSPPAEGQRGSNAPLGLLSPQRVPLCGAPHALVRNDMLKTGRCARVQGRFRQYTGSAPWQTRTHSKFLHVIARSIVACADTWQISACHCEERSDVAIRSPCGGA